MKLNHAGNVTVNVFDINSLFNTVYRFIDLKLDFYFLINFNFKLIFKSLIIIFKF